MDPEEDAGHRAGQTTRREKVKQLSTLLLLAAAALGWAADPPAVAPAPEKVPEIVLPPGEVPDPASVVKYDPTAMKARDVPYHVSLVKAPEAWAKNPLAKGKGIKIAVVDTHVQRDHPGFDGMIKGQYDAITKKLDPPAQAEPNPHGTHCASIVHAILPEAEIYAITGLNKAGSGSVADLAHGIDYAVTEFKVDVVSCSFGGPQTDTYLPAAIRRAIDAGVIVVCAAGNDGGPNDTEGYPGRYPDSVSVAACDSNRQLASFSSWGPNVFTADPGVEIWGLLPKNMEGKMSGTSMACPVEAGKVGSWLASNGVPKDKGRREKYLLASKGAMPFKERTNARGYGLYQLDKVTGEAKQPPAPAPPTPGEKVYVVDAAKLKADGYTGVRIDFGAGASTQPIPVMDLKPPPLPGTSGPGGISVQGVQSAPPSPVFAPVYSGPGSVFQGFVPNGPVPMVMPGGCPGGVCQPAPVLFPVLRGWR